MQTNCPDDDAPDIFDLEGWAGAHWPEMLACMRYCHPDTYYEALREFWESKGCPEIREGDPL